MNRQNNPGHESPFDHLTALLCGQFAAPFGLVSMVQGDLAVFRSELGLGERSLPRDVSVSNLLVGMGSGARLVIEDALAHPVLKHHPMVAGTPFLRFFAGATVSNGKGQAVGAVGVMDTKPRPALTPVEISTLDQVAAIAGCMFDQTTVRQLQAERLELLNLAEQMSGVGHWRYDALSQEITWSDEVYRIHGFAPGEIDPRYENVLAFYHPEDTPLVADAVSQAVETGEGYQLRLRLTPRGGEERLVDAKATTEQDESGRTVAVIGVFQDVTEVVRSQERLAESESLFRLLSETSTDIIARFDTRGRFLYVSPAVKAVLGRNPEDMLGKDCAEFIAEEDLMMIGASLRAYVAAGPDAPPPRYEYRATKTDGSTIWLEATPRPVRDATGAVIEFHDHVRDITERKALEYQLIAAKDVAEAGARAKSEFLANMSHELRTPLTSVIGFSGLLKASRNLPEAERKYADRIATGSEALLSVINDILDYSKLEADAVDLELQPFDPRAMAEGAAAMVESQCQIKGLKLETAIDADLPGALMGDEGRLRQVTLNFLANAVKFTDSGTVRLAVTAAFGRLRVAVTDSGIGIAPDKIDALFDRFTQADASTTRVYGGTGLGLAISRRLIEIMGGEIGADSIPGTGSTFWFEVPIQSAVAGMEAGVGVDLILDQGLKILMVDDTAQNRELVTAILGALGLPLETACNGVEAVEAARTGGYDLILMDVQMAVMDGLDATRAIRAMEGEVGRTPIIALTANVQPEHVARCLEAGMDGHVGKPIQVTELLTAIATAAGRTRSDLATTGRPRQGAVA